ncbi:MAG: ABC transporter ATP-binding protein [Actinomycetota bacterium]|nr:ABC transporter ATP-binding protein [Actinomycetota bacterium]
MTLRAEVDFPAGGPVVDLRGVTRTYQRAGAPVQALRGVDLCVQPGELVVLMGPSGCGKTTLLNVLGGLDRADSGSVHVAGVDLMAASQGQLDGLRQRHVGIMLQSDNLLSTATATEQVALRLLARGVGWRAARAEAVQLLAQVGLADRLHHRPDSLSGGEQQRVALARALAGGPQLVLADEPTGELDSDTTLEMIALIARSNRQLGTSFVIATHDPLLATGASRVVRLRDGVVEAG